MRAFFIVDIYLGYPVGEFSATVHKSGWVFYVFHTENMPHFVSADSFKCPIGSVGNIYHNISFSDTPTVLPAGYYFRPCGIPAPLRVHFGGKNDRNSPAVGNVGESVPCRFPHSKSVPRRSPILVRFFYIGSVYTPCYV